MGDFNAKGHFHFVGIGNAANDERSIGTGVVMGFHGGELDWLEFGHAAGGEIPGEDLERVQYQLDGNTNTGDIQRTDPVPGAAATKANAAPGTGPFVIEADPSQPDFEVRDLKPADAPD